jgi:hypothetical protein
MARRRRNRIEEEAKALRKQRRDMLRERKMAVERRKLMSALVPVLVLVFGFVAFGWFRLAWWQPRQPVARVAGTAITAQDYGKRVQFARRQTLNNLSSLLGFLQSTDPSFIQSYVQGQRTGVAQQTLDQMIDERLIREEAEARGITVTDEEIEERICGELSQATGATGASTDADADAEAEDGEDAAAEEDASDEAESETDAEAAADEGEAEDASETEGDEESDEAAEDEGEDVAAPSDELVCALEGPELDRAFETVLEPQLDQAGMSRGDYEELVRAQIYRDKLSESLGEELDTTAEQTEIEYLLFTDESVAADASAALESGESWAAVSARFERPEEPAVEDEAETADEAAAEDEAEGDAETDAADSDEVDEADAAAESDVDEAADDAAVDDEAEGDEADENEATDDQDADTSDDTDADAEASDEGDEADTESDVDEAEDEAATGDEAEGDEADEAADEEATEDESEGDEADEDASDEDAAAEDSEAAEEDGAVAEGDEAAEDDSAADEDGDETGDDTGDEAAEEPEPAPTPEPDPYAFDISERQWFTAEQLQTRLGLTETEVEEIFGLDAGSNTEPLQGSQGFYILHVLDKDADREIDEGELQRLKDSAMEEWLTETRLSKSSEINRFPTDGLIPEEPDWFVQGFDQLTSSLGGQAPLDLGGLDTSGGTSP